jgi:putative YhdH/YhfP family quinone oxidoreductase
MLAARGYEVVASTGKTDKRDWLRQLGASEVVDRSAIASSIPARPLETERWQSAVDVVGGETLASVLRAVVYGGSVATSGLAGSAELQMTVHPFILRAVNLIGIDSAYNTRVQRIDVWRAIADDFAAIDRELLVAGELGLVDVPNALVNIKEAAVAGRLLVDISR